MANLETVEKKYQTLINKVAELEKAMKETYEIEYKMFGLKYAEEMNRIRYENLNAMITPALNIVKELRAESLKEAK